MHVHIYQIFIRMLYYIHTANDVYEGKQLVMLCQRTHYYLLYIICLGRRETDGGEIIRHVTSDCWTSLVWIFHLSRKGY